MRHVRLMPMAMLCLAAHAALVTAADARPNIIFMLADDYGIDGVGCYGSSRHRTPNIDRLAADGARFDACFAEPLCGPSRALLMSGKYPFRTGVVSNQSGGKLDPKKDLCIAKLLSSAGYATAVAGKWPQLGFLKTAEDGRVWGWDEFMIWDGNGTPDRYWSPRYNKNGTITTGDEKQYGPDLLHEFCVDFITRHREQPFFLYYPIVLVHSPIVRTPDTGAVRTRESVYADNVAYLDKLVGQLKEQVERLGLSKNTVFVFAGDNGSVAQYQCDVRGAKFAGGKGSLTDGGSRVPLIACWPGVISAGRVVGDFVSFADMYPTFAQLAGAKMPADTTFDGQSMVWQMKGESGTPRKWVYVELSRARYVRDAAWKLNNDRQLFDMRKAPLEETLVEDDTRDPEASAARQRLEATLVGLVGTKLATDGSAPPKPQKPKKQE